MDALVWLLMTIPVAFVAATLAAVTGFGGAAVLLPVLVALFGVREAIPILTVAQLVGNGSRVWFNRRELDWAVVRWFAIGGVPAALIGGWLFAAAPLAGLTRLVGLVLLAMVAYRRLRRGRTRQISLACVVGYALSPIDLIPDFVPVLGYLDDLVLLPAGIWLALRLVPPQVMTECRAQAGTSRSAGTAAAWGVGAALVVLLWLLALALTVATVVWWLS